MAWHVHFSRTRFVELNRSVRPSLRDVSLVATTKPANIRRPFFFPFSHPIDWVALSFDDGIHLAALQLWLYHYYFYWGVRVVQRYRRRTEIVKVTGSNLTGAPNSEKTIIEQGLVSHRDFT